MFHLKKNNRVDEIDDERGRLLREDSPFAMTEAYKAMRTNLLYLSSDSACKKLVFTSALPGEGKTTNCANTAIAFAQMGKRVLLIDADMRKPKIHKLFDCPLAPGLSERLAGLDKSTDFAASEQENLSLLTAGRIPPNPAELLLSDKMEQLLREAGERFDYIFIDISPVGVVTDAAILAKWVQGYVLVARVDVTPMDVLKETVSTLEKLGAHIVGFLLNDVADNERNYRGRYGDYSGYAYKDGASEA